MNVAICGYPPLAQQIQESSKDSDINFKFFINDFISDPLILEENNFTFDLPLITFFEFRRLINAGELDGIVIAKNGRNDFAKNVAYICKFYKIPKVGVVNLEYPSLNPNSLIYWLVGLMNIRFIYLI